MKTRSGFVSNSSSSSFLIGIPKNTNEQDKLLLEVFSVLTDKYDEDKKESLSIYASKKDYLNYRESYIQEKKEANTKALAAIELLKTIKNKPEAQKAISIWKTMCSKASPTTKIEYMEYDTVILTEEMESFNRLIKRNNDRIKELEDEIKLINDSDIDDKIVNLTVDQHWKSNIEKALVLLIEKGPVKLLKRIDT